MFILNDYASDNKARLIQLDLIPLMCEFELNDVMFSMDVAILQHITLTFTASSILALTQQDEVQTCI